MKINELQMLIHTRLQSLLSEQKVLIDARSSAEKLNLKGIEPRILVLDFLIRELQSWSRIINRNMFNDTIESEFIRGKANDFK